MQYHWAYVPAGQTTGLRGLHQTPSLLGKPSRLPSLHQLFPVIVGRVYGGIVFPFCR